MFRASMNLSRGVVLAVAICGLAAANDGPFSSVPAGGIEFEKSDVISMDKEDLFISLDEVRVAYVFKNTSSEDVKTKVAFPLPIWHVGDFECSDPMYAEFSVKVNGKPVDFETRVRAVLFDEAKKGPFLYSKGPATVKKDVTDILTKHDVELRECEKAWENIEKLGKDAQDDLIKEGVIQREGDYVAPLWGVQVAYIWEQTFPANAETRIEHKYVPQAGYFSEWHFDPWYKEVSEGRLQWKDMPAFGTDEFDSKCADFLKYFEIDNGVLAWAAKQREAKKRFSFAVVDYILTTAAYWHGPIKDFTLTIAKSKEGPSAISAAIDGLKKIDDTHFQVKRTNYTPDKDLAILFIHPVDME
ncbi:MAG: DUF4424 domain-containing protein [Candidatus Hydrogenedentes bacterium]|nr:DUF4424 domain-containing protein [Candidatus Hydrogenedentota bacterium]